MEIKPQHILAAVSASMFLSCQADSPPGLLNQKALQQKEQKDLPLALKEKIKKRNGDVSLVKIKTFAELKRELEKNKNLKLDKSTASNQSFGLKQATEVSCDGNICSYESIGDWGRYYDWESYYSQVYNDNRYAPSIRNRYLAPTQSNDNGDQLCAYTTREFCTEGDGDCKTHNTELTLYGCICPQQFNQSPPNFQENPSSCAQYDHLLAGDGCSIYWQKINSCYAAGGNPSGDPRTCHFIECAGVEPEEFCQTYTVGGQTKESCTTCPDGQDMFYSQGIAVACRPTSQTSNEKLFFRTQGGQMAPYGSYRSVNNNYCDEED